MPKKAKPQPLDEALAELESLVETMESGDLSLEAAMQKFERGIELTRYCQTALKDAEQKVDILMKKTLDAEAQPFDNDED